LIREARGEWLRYRGRRDVPAVLAGYAALITFRELQNIAAISSLSFPPGVPVPPEVLAEQTRQLAGYAGALAVPSVLLSELPLLTLLVGFVTCWTVGSELAAGVVRTALIANPVRRTYVAARLGGAQAFAMVAVLVTVFVGAALPYLAPVVGASLPPGQATTWALLGFVGASLLLIYVVVSLASLITLALRSAVLAILVFAAAYVGSSLATTLLVTGGLDGTWLPLSAMTVVLEQLAPNGALIPSAGAITAYETGSAHAALAGLAVGLWSLALSFASVALFERRDISS